MKPASDVFANIDCASRWLAQLNADAVVPMVVGFECFWPIRRPKDGDWERALEDVCTRRAHIVASYELGSQDISEGQLLAYWPEMSLSDGAAEVETRGFFDPENTPIADTWVGWLPDTKHYDFGGALLSWIPKSWLARVNDGVAVNPEECISWACTEVLPDHAASFASAGLKLPTKEELRDLGLCLPQCARIRS